MTAKTEGTLVSLPELQVDKHVKYSRSRKCLCQKFSRFNSCCFITSKHIALLLQLPWKTPCCCSCTMLTGIVANFRQQSRPALVRTTLTSSHAYLQPRLLPAKFWVTFRTYKSLQQLLWQVWQYIDSNLLGPGRSLTGDAAGPSSPFTQGDMGSNKIF